MEVNNNGDIMTRLNPDTDLEVRQTTA